MLKNRSFRTKLAFAIAPPLLVLLTVVATVVRPRIDDARDAAHKVAMVELADRSAQVRGELQSERNATIERIVSRPGATIELADVRASTDARVTTLRRTADALTPQTATERASTATAISAVDDLVVLRAQIDTGTVGPLQVFESYEILVDRLGEPARSLVRDITDPELLREANANVAYLEYTNAVSRMSSYLGLRVESGTVTQTDLLRVGADLAVADEYRRQFRSSAPTWAVALDDQVTAGAAFATAADLRETIELSGARNTTPNIKPSEWWKATAEQLAGLESVESQTFASLRADAAAAERSAKQDATIYLSALGVGVLLAALAAVGFARSIAERLAKVTNDARVIATDRLPEVLDALRNPSPEVLAQTLPQVPADATDEIGSLAGSFNTVLRTAVETSIGHAQRRAATLTNILVNLGRRNQALIDRQLELVDHLESTQRDPEVLRGLFQLDHMITTLRRNAENLLVLASDNQGRAWSAPVPVVDVLRGAVAEVEDMSRIAFELDLTETTTVGGRHAVDLSHLVAELVDNALAFSPPATPVQLRAERTTQHYRVWVLDAGVGMTDDELVDANRRVTNPPDIDDVSTDRIGFQVVGRLARRLGVQVHLQANPGGGIAACVTVPAAMLDVDGSLLDDAAPPVTYLPADVDHHPLDEADALDGDELAWALSGPAELRSADTDPAGSDDLTLTDPTTEDDPDPAETAAGPAGGRVHATARRLTLVPFTDVDAAPASESTPAFADPVPALADNTAAVAEPALGASEPTPASAPDDAPAEHAPLTVRRRSWLDDQTGAGAPTTASGLQRRVPGQSFVSEEKAEEFDSGQFRRLPMPGDRTGNAIDAAEMAQHRLDALKGLQSGAGRARDAFFTDDES